MKGTAPRGRWLAEDEADRGAPRGLVEGPRRERDDRRPAPQRPGPDRRTGSVEVERMLEPERYETVWQLTSTIEGDLRPDDHVARHVPRAVPERIGHRRAQGAHDADHRATSRTRPAASTAARSATSRRRGPASRARTSTSRSERWPWTARPRTAEYGVGGGITHDSSAARRVRGDRGEGARADRRADRRSSCSRAWRTCRPRGSGTWTSTSSGSPRPRGTSASGSSPRPPPRRSSARSTRSRPRASCG